MNVQWKRMPFEDPYRTTSGNKAFVTWRYFADCGRVPSIALVAVGTLDKDGTVTEALCKHLSSNVVQPYPSTCKAADIQCQKQGEFMKQKTPGYVMVSVPICLRVSSTAELRLTFDNKPRQKRSELDGSVNPSTVSEGWDAWKVSPTRWFSSQQEIEHQKADSQYVTGCKSAEAQVNNNN